MDEIKQRYYVEVDTAFEIYKLLNATDWHSWHRIIGIVEQLKNKDQMLKEEHSKQAYLAQRPVGV